MTFSPTKQQATIIEVIGSQPNQSVMVDARAGCAKTSTIEMAAGKIPRQLSCCAVAFNKRIADELKTRLPSHIECLTMNAMGHRAWSGAIGGKRLLVDPDKVNKLVKAHFAQMQVQYDAEEDTFAEVQSLVRGAKSCGLVPKGAPMGATGLIPDNFDSWEEIAFQKGFEANDQTIMLARQVLMRSIKAAYSGEIDFDDQIYMSVLFGGTYPNYHTVIVDEAQDLSPLNHRQLIKATGTRLIAVGDPYQAIYAFRGADDNSMTNLMEHFAFIRLGLTASFRVPKLVSERQLAHVPDFSSFPSLPDGTVERWEHDWSIGKIPNDGFILCRNNAPLMKMAFTLIKARRPVNILGRDIGTSLANLLAKICKKKNLPVEEAFPLVQAWAAKELAKVEDSPSKAATIIDRRECLEVLLEASGAATTNAAIDFIKELFTDKAKGDLTLASGHKAKGLEKRWVLHLDPWRVPSKQSLRAMDHGNPAPMVQEQNLKYVIETRTQDTLVMANLEDCAEVQL